MLYEVITVNFGARVEQKTQVTQAPGVGVGSSGYRRAFYPGWTAYAADVRQYDEGTLNVDLVDPEDLVPVEVPLVHHPVRERDLPRLRGGEREADSALHLHRDERSGASVSVVPARRAHDRNNFV